MSLVLGRAVVNTTTTVSSSLRRTTTSVAAANTKALSLSLSSWSRTRLSASQSHHLASTSQYARSTVYTPISIERHHQLRIHQLHLLFNRPTPPLVPLRGGRGRKSPYNHVQHNNSRPYSSKVNETRKDHDDPDSQRMIQDAKEKQNRAPWHREGSSDPPVRKKRWTGSMTKGKLLTTPSKLLKLIIPVTSHDHNEDGKDVEPLALLVHPQQPLSYLERLIQSEVPPIKGLHGEQKPPSISFLAMEQHDDSIRPKRAIHDNSDNNNKCDGEYQDQDRDRDQQVEEEEENGTPRHDPSSDVKEGGPEGGVETYSYLRRPHPGQENKRQHFVRWSSSTEIGDFIRDAARANEFIIIIEDSPLGQIRVGVPSFNDRTYYLRMRLRKVSKKIKNMALIKHECDALAHRGAQRVAIGGFGILVLWWYLVYRLTFETDLGWDTMEPVTYLASLSTLMGGYLWFLYHNREVSYRSALDFTISRRQKKLYQMKGVDLQLWESLVDEGNMLRKEIKTVAAEYDVEWDERADEQDERVTKALEKERHAKDGKPNREEKDTHDDDD